MSTVLQDFFETFLDFLAPFDSMKLFSFRDMPKPQYLALLKPLFIFIFFHFFMDFQLLLFSPRHKIDVKRLTFFAIFFIYRLHF